MKKPTAIGAYIFAGGFTVGVKQAGFNVLCHLEGDDAYGISTIKLNYPRLSVYHGPKCWPLKELADQEVDLVYGNPPCAAWSVNNPHSHQKGSWRDDPRVDCARQHFDLLKALRPKCWLWESVTQVATKGRPLVDSFIRRARRLGYAATEVFHDARWLGVPQKRSRWMLCLHRVQLNFPTLNWSPPVNTIEALLQVAPEGTPAYVDLNFERLTKAQIKTIHPGERLCRWWERFNPKDQWVYKPNGHVKGRPGFGHIRLPLEGPATATVGYGMIHPTEQRFLHINEVAAIAGYPPGYVFAGNEPGYHSAESSLIARGLCPPVGRWFATIVHAAIKQNRSLKDPQTIILDLRKPPIEK